MAVLNRFRRFCAKFWKKLKSPRGYIAIIMTAFIPLAMLGLKYYLASRTAKQTDIYKTGDTIYFKKCAAECALEIAKHWNPGLTLYQQRPSVLRKADEIYNESPTYHAGIMGEAIGAETDGISTAPSIKQISMSTYTAYYPRFNIGAAASDRNLPLYAFYSRIYNLAPNPNTTILNYEGDPASAAAIDYLEDAEPAATISRCTIWQSGDTTGVRTNMRSESQSQISSGYGGRSGGFTSNPAGGQYTQRTNLEDPKLQISVENDLIKVTTDGDVDEKYQDIGYAWPAWCDVDIILTVPTNMAANNPDNLDSNTLTAGNALIRSGQTGMNTADFMGTPIYEITRAYHKFLRNFMFTQGVGVGLIPYDANVGIPDARAADWTRPLDLFKVDNWPNSPYLRRAFLYGTHAASTDLQANNPLLSTHHGPNTYSMNAIFSRAGSTTQEANYGNNTLFKGDILSNDAPTSDATKFVRQYYRPAQFINMLNMKSEAGYEGHTSLHPFHIAEITNNLDKIYNLLSIIGPHNGDRKNVSNFVFLPIIWANNLFQSWTADKVQTSINTTSATTNSTASGILYTPSKSNSKKAVILVVNKPDFFKENELTYLGYSDDFSEIPMVESDKICFDVDYSDTSKKFADNTAFDGTIQGAKKILKYETTSGTVAYDSTAGYYQATDGAEGKLTFPRKHLVKLVVAPKFEGENSGKHKITGETTYIFKGTVDERGPYLPPDGTVGLKAPTNGTQGPFGHNLSPYKVKYALENATITACNLRRQVLRDYVGQYGRALTDVKRLILRSGRLAALRGNPSWDAYTVYSTYGITQSSIAMNESQEIMQYISDFMDPCVRLTSFTSYSNDIVRCEYNPGTVQYLISGLNEENIRAYMATYGDISMTRGSETRATNIGDSWIWYWYHIAYDSTLDETANNTLTLTSTSPILEMYLCNAENRELNYEDPKLENIHKTLCSNTNPFANEGVYLLNDWICFNGDAKLEVTVTPNSTTGGYITFFNDNREDVTASITVNGTTYNDIKEEKEIYVEAANISGSSAPYSIAITNMQNIRLVSAEITNRAYTKKTPTVTLSGTLDGTGTAYLETNVKKPITLKTNFEWPPRPIYSGTIDFTVNQGATLTSGNVITNGDLSYETTSGTVTYISTSKYKNCYAVGGADSGGVRSASGKLSFPGGNLLKIVVEPHIGGEWLNVTGQGGSDEWTNMGKLGTTNNKIQAVCTNGSVAESEDGVNFHKVYDLSKPATKYMTKNSSTSELTLEPGGTSVNFNSSWVLNGVLDLFINQQDGNQGGNDYSDFRRMINGSVCRVHPSKSYYDGSHTATMTQYLRSQDGIHIANGICVVFNEDAAGSGYNRRFYSSTGESSYLQWTQGSYLNLCCRVLGYGNGRWIASHKPTKYNTGAVTGTWTGSDNSLYNLNTAGDTWYGGTFVNDRFYAVNSNGGQIAESFDGTNWKMAGQMGQSGYHNITWWKGCLWSYRNDGQTVVKMHLGSIRFTNITSSDLTKTTEYPVTGKKTFYIDLTKTNGSNVTFDMKNIRLISAELISNKFTSKIPTCSLSGTTEATDGAEHECYITTNVQEPITLKVNRIPLVFEKINVGVNLSYINYGNARYVANDGSGLYTGSTLTSLSKVVNEHFENPVAYGNGAFVATSYNGAYADWGEGFNRISNNRVYSCCFGDNLFVVGDLSSVNGKDFTPISSQDRVFYGNGLYVGGTYNIYTSPTGTGNWANKGYTDKLNWPGCYGNGKFLIPAYYGTILTSSDGETWTSVNSGTSNDLRSVCWTGKRFIAVGASGTIITSTDSEHWYSVPTEFNNNVPDVKVPSGVSTTLKDIQVLNNNEVVIIAGSQVLRAPMPQGYIKYKNPMEGNNYIYNGYIDDQTITIDPYAYEYVEQSNDTYKITLTLKDVQVSDLKFIDEQGICENGQGPQAAPSYITYKALDGITDVKQYPTAGETITISPETHYYEKLNNGNYRITLNVTSNETTTATRLSDPAFKDITSAPYEFEPLRAPQMSRYADYNQNISSHPYVSNTSLLHIRNDAGIRWDSVIGAWVTKPNEAYNGKWIVSAFNSVYWDQVPGNAYCIFDSSTSRQINNWTTGNLFNASGLFRINYPFSFDEYNDFYTNIHDADISPAKFEIAGWTLPINTMLYYGASGNELHHYKWQSDESGNIIEYDPSKACQQVTKDACAKLKNDWKDTGIRIYVIKYRKQTQYRLSQNVNSSYYSGSINKNWDYGYIDDCSTDKTKYVYDVSDKATLDTKLQEIANDIKTWAGYKEAKNVDPTSLVVEQPQ